MLLAEDSPLNRLIAAGVLEKQGYHAVAVANGLEAVEISPRDRFDAILMDVHLPVIDGFVATRQIWYC